MASIHGIFNEYNQTAALKAYHDLEAEVGIKM